MANRGSGRRGLPMNHGNERTEPSAEPADEWHAKAERLREEQNELLKAAGFEPVGTGDLWAKGGVYYGRAAALQNARRE
jgi:hypothetical protein